MLLQFLLVIVSVGGIVFYMNSQTATSEVFIYNKNFIESNQIVTEDDIRSATIPTVAVTQDFALKKEEIVGRYAQTGVKVGQYVYKEQLTEAAEKDEFETLDMKEYRKVSLPIDMVEGLSGNIEKGDKIDLVFSGKGVKNTGDLYTATEFNYSATFLQNVLVYSVNTADGYLFEGYSDVAEGTAVDENGEPIKNSKMGIITLAVTLEQAEEIYSRRQVGTVSFVGRFEESQDVETFGYAVGDYGPVFSGKAPIEITDIEAFRANPDSATPSVVAPSVAAPGSN